MRRLFSRRRLAGLYGVYLAVIVLSMTPFIAQEAVDRMDLDGFSSDFQIDKSVTEEGYSIQLRDSSIPGQIWVNYNDADNQFTIFSDNVDSLTLDLEWFLNNRDQFRFLNEDATHGGMSETATGNDAKMALIEKGPLNILLHSDDGVDEVTIQNTPYPYRVSVNDETWTENMQYTMNWNQNGASIITSIPAGEYVDVEIDFQSPSGSGGVPRTNFVVSGDRAYAGKITTLDATSTTDSDSSEFEYYWDFGDGSYSYTTTPLSQHVYDEVGEYIALLTVKDNTGNVDTSRLEIEVVNAPAGTENDEDGDGYSNYEETHIYKTDPNDPTDNPETQKGISFKQKKVDGRTIRVIGPENVNINVEVPATTPKIPNDMGKGLNIFLDISVDGELTGPVTIYIDLSPADVAGFDINKLRILHHNDDTDTWEVMSGTHISSRTDGGYTLYVDTDSLSIFSVAEVEEDSSGTGGTEEDEEGIPSWLFIMAAVILVVIVVIAAVAMRRGGDESEEEESKDAVEVEEEEEQEEEEDLFECPICSAVVRGSDKSCPECGEEFEPLDDDEDDDIDGDEYEDDDEQDDDEEWEEDFEEEEEEDLSIEDLDLELSDD